MTGHTLERTPGNSPDPATVPGSPEALAVERAVADFKRECAELGENFAKQTYLPTLAELAAIQVPRDLALAHGRVILTLFGISLSGRERDSNAPDDLSAGASLYLVRVLKYLCARGAGILLAKDPVYRGGGHGTLDGRESILLSSPIDNEWRDASYALRTMLVQANKGIGPEREPFPLEDVLCTYLDSGYFGPLPGVTSAPHPIDPPAPFRTWLEACAFYCRREIVRPLIDRGFDFSRLPTERMLGKMSEVLTFRKGWSLKGEATIHAAQRELFELEPGSYGRYFEVVTQSAQGLLWGSWAPDDDAMNHSCAEDLKARDRFRSMNDKVERAIDGASASPQAPDRKARPKVRV